MNGIREALGEAAASLEGSSDGGGVEAPEPVHAGTDSAGDAGPVGEVPEPASNDAGRDGQPGKPEVVGTAAQRARDATGKFTKAEAKAQAAAKAVASKAGEKEGAQQSETAKPAATPASAPPPPSPDAIKAPQSWKPAAREKWAAMPPEVQQEVTRRERETATALQESAESRKVHQQFREVVGPYEGLLRAAGSEPMAAIGQLLQTGAGLRHGSEAQKAQLIANVIKEYGVSVPTLDKVLAGQATQEAQPQQQAAQFRDPRIDQMLQQQQQRQMQKAQTDIGSFASTHEFYADVKEDMADLLETRGRRGVAMTLEEAYNLACKTHPDVSGVFEQRKAAEAAKAAVASTQRARAASTSVRTQPAGTQAPQPKGIREVLAEAAAKVGR